MDNGGALKAPPKREFIEQRDKYKNESNDDTDDNDEYDNEYNDEYNNNHKYNNKSMGLWPYEPQYDIPRDREFESLMEDDIPFLSRLLNPSEPHEPKTYGGITHEQTPSLDRKKTRPVYYNRPARSDPCAS